MTCVSGSEEDANAWKQIFPAALSIAQELDLDYFTSNPSRLNLTEGLYLLSRKVQLGLQIPDSLSCASPWNIPKSSHAKYDVINDLLNYSLSVQSGLLKEIPEFNQYILSRSPRIISGFLYRYFKYVNINVQLVSGVMTFTPSPESDATPYTWLNIIGDKPHIIDNTYVHVPNPAFFFKMKDKRLYVKEDPSETKRKLFMDNTSESHPDLKSYEIFTSSQDNLEKLLVFMLQWNPRVKMYDILMRHYLKTKYNIIMENFEITYKDICWKCKIKSNDLKTCQGCKITRYCGKFCQKKDWSVHKHIHNEAIASR